MERTRVDWGALLEQYAQGGASEEHIAFVRAMLNSTEIVHVKGSKGEIRKQVKKLLDTVIYDEKKDRGKLDTIYFQVINIENGERVALIAAGRDTFFAVDVRADFSFVSKYVIDNQELEIAADLRRKGSEGGKAYERSEILPHFKELVGQSLSYADRMGIKISRVAGNWSTDAGPSDNFRIFKDALSQGQSNEQAALLTPTGKAAVHYGFTEVEVHYPVIEEHGTFYNTVNASFIKPSG